MDFSQLFATVDTIPPGYESGVFTSTHLIVLASVLLVIGLIGWWFYKSDRETRDKMLFYVAVFGVVNEILKDLYLFGLGQIKWAHMPLHLCGINIIMIAIYQATKHKSAAEWLYAMSLPGGLIALVSPDWAELPVANIMFWQANSIHAVLMLYPILLLIDGFVPHAIRFLKVLPWLFALAAVIYPINKLLDTNFLFLNWAPIGTPFEVFESWFGNPGYIASFAALFGLAWFLMYLPWRKKAALDG